VQPCGAYDELADVDRGEATRDAFENHVRAVPVEEHRVDERLRQVDPTTAGLEHALHELLHLGGAQDRGGELVLAPRATNARVGSLIQNYPRTVDYR
jgi:hypothetical protein